MVVRSSRTLEVTSRLAMLTNNTPFTENYETTLPAFEGVDQWEIASSVDGLCMLYMVDIRVPLLLWNPSIRKYRIVPTLVAPEEFEDLFMYGVEWQLGFDPSSQDYKYVRLVHIDNLQFIAVYSVGLNSWKKIEIQSEDLCWWDRYYGYHVNGICFRGILYRITEMIGGALQLVSFDLSTETLSFTVLRYEFQIRDPRPVLTVADGGSSMAMVVLTGNKGFLWVCQSIEGDNKYLNWTKRYIFTCRLSDAAEWYWHVLLYTKKNGEMLFNWVLLVTSYHIETQEDNILLQNSFYVGPYWPYAESLVLLNEMSKD